MRQTGIILMFSLLTVIGQAQDTVMTKARFNVGELNKHLSKTALYPGDGLKRNMQGDVIVSYTISRKGTLDSMKIISTPGFAFSASAITAMNSIDGDWSPATVNGTPVDKKYLTIFRYRMYLDVIPTNYHKTIEDLFAEEKYKRALKFCNAAIRENRYDYEILEYRSQIKRKLGDIEGSEKDRIASINLNNEVMLFIDIKAIGVSRKPVLVESEIRRL